MALPGWLPGSVGGARHSGLILEWGDCRGLISLPGVSSGPLALCVWARALLGAVAAPHPTSEPGRVDWTRTSLTSYITNTITSRTLHNNFNTPHQGGGGKRVQVFNAPHSFTWVEDVGGTGD